MVLPTATIDINVTVTGTSLKGKFSFEYESTNPCLDNEQGDITLPANKRPVAISFTLLTTSIKLAEGTFSVSFDLGVNSGGASTTGEDTLWLWPDLANKGKSSPKVFSQTQRSSTSLVVSTVDDNSDAQLYHYGLAVGILIAKDASGKFQPPPQIQRDDPRIKNGGIGQNAPIRLSPLLVVAAITAVVIVLMAAWKLLG